MKQIEKMRNLVIFAILLAIVLIGCVSNIVKLNIFALVVNMLLVIFICFLLGYNYCKYEDSIPYEERVRDVVLEKVEEEKVEEVEETLSEAIERLAFGGSEL